jgi:hypothetical protein
MARRLSMHRRLCSGRAGCHDDEARQKLLVLVPALIRCAGADHAPDIESA